MLPPYPCPSAPIDGHCPQTPTYSARECTSGASWWGSRITGKPWPTGFGDAENWPAAARAAGMDVGTDCQPNSIMCIPPNRNGAGPKGHVAVVVARPINGKATVWEMNFLIEHGFDFRQADIEHCEYIHLTPLAQPAPHPLPTEDDPMFALLDVDNGGTHIMFGTGLLVNITDSSSISALLSLKNCAGRAKVDAGTLTNLLASPINKGTP